MIIIAALGHTVPRKGVNMGILHLIGTTVLVLILIVVAFFLADFHLRHLVGK